MTVTVAKSTVVENIYKNFYDLVSAVSAISSVVFPAFHEDINLTSKSDYPIVVINSPEISSDSFTFGKGLIEGTIDVDIYTVSADTADQFSSDVIDKIETSKGTLAGVKLREVHLSGTIKETILHGDIKVHHKMLTFRYKFYYTKTSAF